MPARALNGKTPFKMKLTRKPNLANIHKFGAAAYVKNLKARKLDSRALVGHFCKGDCRVGLSQILAGGPKLIYYAK